MCVCVCVCVCVCLCVCLCVSVYEVHFIVLRIAFILMLFGQVLRHYSSGNPSVKFMISNCCSIFLKAERNRHTSLILTNTLQ